MVSASNFRGEKEVSKGTGKSKYVRVKGLFPGLFSFACLSILGFVMLLNLQPWMFLARPLVAQIDTGPILGFLNWAFGSIVSTVVGAGLVIAAIARHKKAPVAAGALLFCGLISLSSPSTLVGALTEIVGFLMWLWIQFVQISPMLAKHSLIPNSAQWLKELKRYRVAAYFLEIAACFYKYPPYASGDLSKLIFDVQNGTLSAANWSWQNFWSAAIVILAVEMVLVFLLKAATFCGVFRKA